MKTEVKSKQPSEKILIEGDSEKIKKELNRRKRIEEKKNG
jgi:hypothetical protein